MKSPFFAIALFVASQSFGGAALADGADVAMITLIQGQVSRGTPQGPQPVQAFTKLRHGDLMIIDRGAQLQIVYFDSGRQETWTGGGRLEVARADSTPFGLAPPAVKILPAVVVKQIAKTPALDSQGRAGMLRLRAVGPVGDLAAVEASYEKLRGAAESSDLSPELYLFSALFEMRQYDRLEKALANLQQIHPANPSESPGCGRNSRRRSRAGSPGHRIPPAAAVSPWAPQCHRLRGSVCRGGRDPSASRLSRSGRPGAPRQSPPPAGGPASRLPVGDLPAAGSRTLRARASRRRCSRPPGRRTDQTDGHRWPSRPDYAHRPGWPPGRRSFPDATACGTALLQRPNWPSDRSWSCATLK